MTQTGNLHIAEIRALAARFSPEKIDKCVELALHQRDNPCITDRDIEETMDVLAKAGFVKAKMVQGMSRQEAIRELGRRIRAVQGPVDKTP